MQIGIRLHDTKDTTLIERLQVAKEQGFSCAHLALRKVITEFDVNQQALTPGLAMYLKREFEKQQIDISILGCYLNLAHPDKEKLENIIKEYKANIRFARILGCGMVGTETGAPNAAYTYSPECHSEEALQIFITNLKKVVADAEKMGVIIGIEPVWGHIVYNSKRALEVIKAVDSPNLQIIFDPVNLLSLSNYQDRDRIIATAMEDLEPYIAAVHIKDFIIKDNKMCAVAVGNGEMNYKQIKTFLEKKKPFIHATLENTTPDNAIRAREYIENL